MAEHHVISRVMQLLDRFRYYSSTLNNQEMSPPPYAIIIIYYTPSPLMRVIKKNINHNE